MIRNLVVILAVAIAGMGAGPDPQALQPAQVIPTGRVCIENSSGPGPRPSRSSTRSGSSAPAPGALAWINAQLKANGYAAIP